MKHPITRDELESYGFDGWISDYVKGPPPVLKMMARENGIDITVRSKLGNILKAERLLGCFTEAAASSCQQRT